MPYFSESAPVFPSAEPLALPATAITCRRRRRGLHVEEPIISDEENQSAFSLRLERLLVQSAIARRDVGLDFLLCFNQARRYGTWSAIKTFEVVGNNF